MPTLAHEIQDSRINGDGLDSMDLLCQLSDPCLRERCTTSPAGRRIILNFHEARLQAARAEQTRPSTRRKLRRRSLVERKLAELKTHGMRKTRYRGQRKVLLQIRLTAALVNAKKLFNLDIPAMETRIA